MNDMEEEQQKPDACASCEEYLAGWKRALADYDNLKKDLGRERDEMRRYAIENAVAAFLPALEHFDAAAKHAPELDEKAKKWRDGILHIQRELDEAMKSLGLQPFGAEGDFFDPSQHESVGQSAGDEKGTGGLIVDVVRRGWKLGERVLRPAKVIVSI
jgi:molecular chaperone GrpE